MDDLAAEDRGARCCDTHVHVFGPIDRFPLPAGIGLPPDGSLPDYLAAACGLGLTRHVFVQPSPYGSDNECQLQAAEQLGADARAIIALPVMIDDTQIAALDRRGARGVRLNAGLDETPDAERLAAMTRRVETMDAHLAGSKWCIEILAARWMIEALLPTLRRAKSHVVLCHAGMFPAALGPEQPGFIGLLRLLEHGLCWIKLTGVYRWSSAPDFADTFPMLAALARAAPDRLLWGSDHPHVQAPRKVSNATLLALLRSWFPEQPMQRKVLVTNPEVLFGFAASPVAAHV